MNIYSKSKLKGEDFVLENGGVILRTNFVEKVKIKKENLLQTGFLKMRKIIINLVYLVM